MCHPQPTSGGTGVDEDFGSLQVAASPVGLLLQDISVSLNHLKNVFLNFSCLDVFNGLLRWLSGKEILANRRCGFNP